MLEERIKSVLTDILDIEPKDIGMETDIIKNLGAESIDLLEIGLSLEREFGIKVDENKLFLKSFRFYMDEARQKNLDKIDYLKKRYPFLGEERIKDLLDDARHFIMPSIKVKDLISYVAWMLGRDNKKEKEYKEI
ncbi:MAG: hypothetical protein DRG39_06075 [Deltaproteobacteria bacterium]|nr:MAG: hypothetical protein DRG39_06075 [Deltaproteobacteria bacterium]